MGLSKRIHMRHGRLPQNEVYVKERICKSVEEVDSGPEKEVVRAESRWQSEDRDRMEANRTRLRATSGKDGSRSFS